MSGVYLAPAQPAQQAPAGASRPDIATVTAVVVSGRLVASWAAPGGGVVWLTRVRVSADVNCTARLYVGTRDANGLVSGTYSGGLDEYDANQPIYVPDGWTVYLEWETTTGAASARIEYVRP